MDIIRDEEWSSENWHRADDLIDAIIEHGIDLSSVRFSLAHGRDDDLLHSTRKDCSHGDAVVVTVQEARGRLCGSCVTIPSLVEHDATDALLDWAEDVAHNHLLLDDVEAALAQLDELDDELWKRTSDRLVIAISDSGHAHGRDDGRTGSRAGQHWVEAGAARTKEFRDRLGQVPPARQQRLERAAIKHLVDAEHPEPTGTSARDASTRALREMFIREIAGPERYLTVFATRGTTSPRLAVWEAVRYRSGVMPGLRTLVLAQARVDGTLVTGPGLGALLFGDRGEAYWSSSEVWQARIGPDDTDAVLETAAVLVREGGFGTLDEALAAARAL